MDSAHTGIQIKYAKLYFLKCFNPGAIVTVLCLELGMTGVLLMIFLFFMFLVMAMGTRGNTVFVLNVADREADKAALAEGSFWHYLKNNIHFMVYAFANGGRPA